LESGEFFAKRLECGGFQHRFVAHHHPAWKMAALKTHALQMLARNL